MIKKICNTREYKMCQHGHSKIPNLDENYMQYPFIRNALIRNNAEISGNFKKPAFKGSNLRNALK